MVPRETGNNANANFGGTNKEYYGIFDSGSLCQTMNELTTSNTVMACSLYICSTHFKGSPREYKLPRSTSGRAILES